MEIKLGAGISLALLLALTGSLSFAEGDAGAGEKVFNRCKACHSLKAGEHRIGPSLANIMGRKAGTAEGFGYSDVMAGSGVVWDESNLSAYLEDPRAFMPGNRMAFPGLKDAGARADVIAYIKSAAQ